MEEISTIGIDIAKSVFQVHGIDAVGEVVVRRQLKRRQVLQFFAALRPCLIGMEACATAHHWARELMRFGHEVRLMPPRYVKPVRQAQAADLRGGKWYFNVHTAMYPDGELCAQLPPEED